MLLLVVVVVVVVVLLLLMMIILFYCSRICTRWLDHRIPNILQQTVMRMINVIPIVLRSHCVSD